jgi:hypothetical protein
MLAVLARVFIHVPVDAHARELLIARDVSVSFTLSGITRAVASVATSSAFGSCVLDVGSLVDMTVLVMILRFGPYLPRPC